MKLNFTGMKRMNFEPVPEGLYEVVVQKVVEGKSGSGFRKMDLTMGVADEGQYFNRKLFATLTEHPNALWKTYEALTAFGYTEEDLAGDDDGDVDFDPQDLVDAGCYVTVIIEEYQGNEKNKIQSFHPHEEIEETEVVIEDDEDFYDDPQEAFQNSELPATQAPKEKMTLNPDAKNVASPAARKALEEFIAGGLQDGSESDADIDEIIAGIIGTGKNGMVIKGDVASYIETWY